MRSPSAKLKRSQSGIALFMVMSALALLSVLVAELTYSTQMNSRLAYNYVDNLKAYYLAKAGLKLSLVRLKAFAQVKNFINDPANKQIKDAMGKGLADKIWNVPFMFPIPVPKGATISETDTVKEFMKESRLSGSFTANITGESSKLNVNNLFVKTAQAEAAAGASGASGANPPPPNPNPNPTPTPTPTPVDFRKVLEPTITNLIEQKKNDDREFADVYRSVQGKDVMDAIAAYLFKDAPPSNLPGFKPIKPKEAPLYSLTELHFIPGFDDELYKLLEPILTVFSVPGLNVNTINKRTLLSLIPEMTETEAEDLLRKRDDPDVGQPWNSADEFWQAVGGTTANKSLDAIKDRFRSANLKILTDEESFKISVLATVGQSTRRLEAFVIVDPKVASKKNGQPDPNGKQGGPQGTPPGVNVAGQPPGGQPNDASAKKDTGVNLIYWRML